MRGALLSHKGAFCGDRAFFRAGLDEYELVADMMPPVFDWLRLAHRAGYEVRYGDLAIAERCADELYVRATETGELDAHIWFISTMGPVMRFRGNPEGFADLNRPYVEVELPVTVHAAGSLMLALCEAERHDEARALTPKFFPRSRALPRTAVFLSSLGPTADRGRGAARPRDGGVAGRAVRAVHRVLVDLGCAVPDCADRDDRGASSRVTR